MKLQQYLLTIESKRAEIEGCKVLQQRFKDKQAFLEAELSILLNMDVGSLAQGNIKN